MFMQYLLTIAFVGLLFLILWNTLGKWILNKSSDTEIDEKISDLKEKQKELRYKKQLLEELKEEADVTEDLTEIDEAEVKVRQKLEKAEKDRINLKNKC